MSLDRRILELLERDARHTPSRLPPCWVRMKTGS